MSQSLSQMMIFLGTQLRWLCVGWCLLMLGSVPAVDVVKPVESASWLDQRNRLIQAHGGGVILHGGTYYWFGTDMGNDVPAGKRAVACYASTDLIHWTFRNRVLQLETPAGYPQDGSWVLERPKVYYSATTKKFVMYMHLDYGTPYQAAEVGVATSDVIDGNYRFESKFRPMNNESRDIGQYVHDDGTAYLISEDRKKRGFHIYQLSSDRLSVVKDVVLVPRMLEGGAIVFMNNMYYFIGSQLTNWDPNPNVYVAAPSLEGLASPEAEFHPLARADMNTYGAQSSYLLKVVGTKATTVIFMGDIWKERDLGNSRYLWMPLEIGNGTMRLPEPQDWTIDVATGQVTFIGKKYAYINWEIPDSVAEETPLTAVQLNATASVSGVLSYSPAMGSILHKLPEYQTLSASLAPTDTVNYQATSKSVEVQVTTLPKVEQLENSPLDYQRLQGNVAISSTVHVTDPKVRSIMRATVAITTSYQKDEDELQFSDTSNISATWDAWTGILTLEGNDSPAHYEEALRNVYYINKSSNPHFQRRAVTIRVNTAGRIWSASCSRSIDITSAPYFVAPPSNRLVAVGGQATFHVEAYGSPAITYQWQRNGVAISGATQSTYTTPTVTQADDGASYTCEIRNALGSFSATAYLSVVRDGLIARWRCDAGSGKTLEDDFGRNTCSLFETTWADGQFGKAAWFHANVFSRGSNDAAVLPLSDQISLSLWAFGDASLPKATTAFRALGAQNQQILNVHLPWSDGSVVWDAGYDGANNDRLKQNTTSPSQYQQQWNHWVFTKNASSGIMAVYLNGQEFASAKGATKPFPRITKIRIGGDETQSFYDGKLDDIRLYNVALSASAVRDLYTGYPAITTQPMGQVIEVGGTASFSVVATGTGPLTYQWMRKGSVISGANQATYVATGLRLEDDGSEYQCAISNAMGTAWSTPAMLQVVPSYVAAHWTCDATSGAILTDRAGTNHGTITNPKWGEGRVGNALIGDDATSIATVVSPSLGLRNHVTISLWAYDASTGARESTMLWAQDAAGHRVLNLHVPWKDGAVYWDAGNTGEAFDRMTWTGTMERERWYHWVFTKNAVTGTMAIYRNGQLCASATGKTMPLPAITYLTIGGSPSYAGRLDDVRIYRKEFSSAEVQDLYASYPTILTAPADQVGAVGGTVTFRVEATGAAPLTYQWLKRGVPLSGATTASYTTPPLTADDRDMEYRCVVSNGQGSVTSLAARVSFEGSLAIQRQPVNQLAAVGGTATFTVVAAGNPAPTYQWQRNGVAVVGATSAMLVISGVSLADDGAQFRCVVTNTMGSQVSSSATLRVGSLPAVLRSPASQRVQVGDTATFTMEASGIPTPTYQWYRNDVIIPGATEATFVTSAVSVNDDDTRYRCVASNFAGSVTSDTATLTVVAAPVVVTQPSPQTASVGGTAIFSVVVSGYPAPTFQWQRQGVPLPGATSATYVTPTLTWDDEGAEFCCVVTNAAGTVTSDAARVTVRGAPVITVAPRDITVAAGAPATWTITARGNPAPTYQWQRNGANIPGATLSTLTIPTTALADDGAQVVCLVTNALGQVSSLPVKLTVTSAPVITVAPRDITVAAGAPATWTITARGNPAPTYQWQRNGANIPGATLSTLTIPTTALADNGAQVVCLVTNALGQVSSLPVRLTVTSAPVIRQHPQSQTVEVGNVVTLTVDAVGNPGVSYQWLRDGVPIAGAVAAVYVTPAMVATDTGARFSCLVANGLGRRESAAATVTVHAAAAPSPILRPADGHGGGCGVGGGVGLLVLVFASRRHTRSVRIDRGLTAVGGSPLPSRHHAGTTE